MKDLPQSRFTNTQSVLAIAAAIADAEG